jgi:F-type H+-transporting ATPase subunit gamma
MLSSAEIDRKLKTFTSVGDIVSAMKAYAGMTMRKTEDLVPNIREYEENVLGAMGDAARLVGGDLLGRAGSGGRLLVAFGSSQGLCGPYNDHLAGQVSKEKGKHDTLFVIGARLQGAIESGGVTIEASADSPVSVSGIGKALEDTVARIIDIYSDEKIYDLTIAFTAVQDSTADIVLERVLPPDLGRAREAASKTPPMTYMEGRHMFEDVLEEFLYISLYRGYLEALRSENWYRLSVLEGATDNLERRLRELGTLKNYVRQEEITEEMLEILQSGMFYG